MPANTRKPLGNRRPQRSSDGALPACTDMRRFQPMTPVAPLKIDDLVARGAVVIQVTSRKVTLRRGDAVAYVDDWARVEWAH